MATTTPNFGWAVPTSTDLVKDGAVAIETLGDAIDASLVDLKGGTTGQVLKKNSNTDMDFVWSADSAGMTNPMTTTGDTIYSSSGSTPARLGIGSSGQVLTVSGGVPTWATPAGGGGKVLQVVSATTSTTTSTTSTTFGDTNLTATITPSATTSKILIMMTVPEVYKTGGSTNNAVKMRMSRGGTGIYQFAGSNFYNAVSADFFGTVSATYLDSPSTTSATTYKLQIATNANTFQVGVIDNAASAGSIILMEIGA